MEVKNIERKRMLIQRGKDLRIDVNKTSANNSISFLISVCRSQKNFDSQLSNVRLHKTMIHQVLPSHDRAHDIVKEEGMVACTGC